VSPFRDVEVHVITHEGEDGDAKFVVYTAIVTAGLLERFRCPGRGPDLKSDASGMEVSRTEVSFWPMLGLKERLAKALGSEIAGLASHQHPHHIGFWEPLVEPTDETPERKPSRKRKREERDSLANSRLARQNTGSCRSFLMRD
jgi:hypothetical protein